MSSVNFNNLGSVSFNYFPEEERRVQERIAQELEIDLNVLDIGIESASEEVALKKGIIEWCVEKFDTREETRDYDNRLSTAKKILACYFLEETKLDLDYITLTSLPENLNLPKLEHLSLRDCWLEFLPKKANLSNLKKIYLDENQLTKLPKNLNLPELEVYSLRGTHLTSLPENLNFPNLKELNLEGNWLTKLPENFNLPKLERLNLSSNKGLQKLPINLINCPNLIFINIIATQIPEQLESRVLRICKARKPHLENCDKIARALGEWNGSFSDDESDLRLPLEMIGEVAELGTFYGRPCEYWARAASLAEDVEMEMLDKRTSSSSGPSESQ